MNEQDIKDEKAAKLAILRAQELLNHAIDCYQWETAGQLASGVAFLARALELINVQHQQEQPRTKATKL